MVVSGQNIQLYVMRVYIAYYVYKRVFRSIKYFRLEGGYNIGDYAFAKKNYNPSFNWDKKEI